MAEKRASECRVGEVVIFRASNGRTLARVTGRETAEDGELIGLHVTLARAVALPDIGWRTCYWTLWHRPDDLLELYRRAG